MEINQTLTQRAAVIVDAASNVGFMPAGVRAALEGAAAFAADCAAAIEDLTQRLSAEAGTNAELLSKVGELIARVEALEAQQPAA